MLVAEALYAMLTPQAQPQVDPGLAKLLLIRSQLVRPIKQIRVSGNGTAGTAMAVPVSE